MNETYKGYAINICVPKNKKTKQIVWITRLNGKQEYKVYSIIGLDEQEDSLIQEALLDCKKHIDMETENTQPVTGGEEVVEVQAVVEDPAEANICDSCA